MTIKKKIWTLFRIDHENGIFTLHCKDSPLTRTQALLRAEEWAKNGGRVWVERKDTGMRIFQSDAEKEEFILHPRQVILCFPGMMYLRVIEDDATEHRIPLRGVKTLPEAHKQAIARGFDPIGFIAMETLGRQVCCFSSVDRAAK